MALVWDARITQAGVPGRTAGRDQRFDYDVRPAFTAKMSCSRVNPQAGCNPIKDVGLSVASPVAGATILTAKLETANCKRQKPRIEDEDKNADNTKESHGGKGGTRTERIRIHDRQ